MNEPNPLLTTKEAMCILGISWNTIYSYIHEGKLKAYKLGGSRSGRGSRHHWRIKLSDLNEFVSGIKEKQGETSSRESS